MTNYYFNDYDKFVGKHITVIYDCGSKCKKLHCKLLKYCEKDSKEKYIILKTRNKIIYYMNCNKIIYWIADYKDMPAENQDACVSNTETMKSNAIAEGENLFLKETQDEEIIPLMPNEDTAHVELQNNDVIISDSKNKIVEKYNPKDIYKKNVLRYPLGAFINCNFQGVYLTIYTTSSQAISGEVIFNYDCLIVLKSDEKTYYINPEQITYFC
jgi:hypothetical protein